MSELKCPFCNKKLEPIGTSGQFQCGTWGCDSSDAEHLLKEIEQITALEQKESK